MNKNIFLTIIITSIFLCANPVKATLLSVFGDEASFLSAAGSGLNFVDFEGLGGNTYNTYDTGLGAVFSSSNTSSAALFVAPAGFSPDITSDSLFGNVYGSTLIAEFSPNVTAVGSELISWVSDSTLLVTVEDLFGNVSSYNVSANPGYFGLIAYGGDITSITYSPGAETVGVDNFYFGTAAVPEPSILALFITGLVGIGFARRRKE